MIKRDTLWVSAGPAVFGLEAGRDSILVAQALRSWPRELD